MFHIHPFDMGYESVKCKYMYVTAVPTLRYSALLYSALPLPFLPVSGWRLSYFYWCFLPLWQSENICMPCQKCTDIWKKPQHLTSQTEFWDMGTELFNTHKTRMNRIPTLNVMKMDKTLIHASIKMACVGFNMLNIPAAAEFYHLHLRKKTIFST